MKNIEFYKNELANCLFLDEAYDFESKHDMTVNQFRSAWKDVFEWLNEEHQILDNTEKKYLSNIIRPFKAKVKCIVKMLHENDEYIEICYMEDEKCEVISFPSFKCGAMYVGMKEYKEYTLNELGL